MIDSSSRLEAVLPDDPVVDPGSSSLQRDTTNNNRVGNHDDGLSHGNGEGDVEEELPAEDILADESDGPIHQKRLSTIIDRNLVRRMSKNYTGSLPTHWEALRTFLGFHLMLLGGLIAVVVVWVVTRPGFDYCTLTSDEVRDRLKTKLHPTLVDNEAISFSVIITAPLVLPNYVFSLIWDLVAPTTALLASGWLLCKYFGPNGYGLLYLFSMVGKLFMLAFGSLQGFLYRDDDNYTTTVFYACVCLIVSVGLVSLLWWCWFDRKSGVSEKYTTRPRYRKIIRRAAQDVCMNCVFNSLTAAAVLICGRKVIPMFLENIQARFGKDDNWFSQDNFFKCVLENLSMFLFFSVVFPTGTKIISVLWMRMAQSSWELHEILFQNGEKPNYMGTPIGSDEVRKNADTTQATLEIISRRLYFMRARHVMDFYCDAMRYASGRVLLLNASPISLASIIIKDFGYHLWNFGLKQQENVFAFRTKIFHPQGRGRLSDRWRRWYPWLKTITLFGNRIPKQLSISGGIELDFQKLRHAQEDYVFMFDGVGDSLGDLEKTRAVGVERLATTNGIAAEEIDRYEECTERTIDMDFDFSNFRMTVKNLPGWTSIVQRRDFLANNVREKSQRQNTVTTQSSEQLAVSRMNMLPVTEEEKKAFEKLLEAYRYETWIRYAIRLKVRVTVSLMSILIPLISSLGAVEQFATFPSGSLVKNTYVVGGLIFLMVDVVEGFTILKWFLWQSRSDIKRHIHRWYVVLCGEHWNRGVFDSSKQLLRRRGILPMFWPFGLYAGLQGFYYTSRTFAVRYAPYDIDAINNHFGTTQLDWTDLKHLCPI